MLRSLTAGSYPTWLDQYLELYLQWGVGPIVASLIGYLVPVLLLELLIQQPSMSARCVPNKCSETLLLTETAEARDSVFKAHSAHRSTPSLCLQTWCTTV